MGLEPSACPRGRPAGISIRYEAYLPCTDATRTSMSVLRSAVMRSIQHCDERAPGFAPEENFWPTTRRGAAKLASLDAHELGCLQNAPKRGVGVLRGLPRPPRGERHRVTCVPRKRNPSRVRGAPLACRMLRVEISRVHVHYARLSKLLRFTRTPTRGGVGGGVRSDEARLDNSESSGQKKGSG